MRGVITLAASLVAVAHAAQTADVAKAAQAVVSQTNALRERAKLATVHEEPRLARAASEFASYMARTNRYGHEADGRDPPKRAEAAGYDYCLVLENIAYEYDSRGFDTARLARTLVEGWRRSPPHRANMLNAAVTHIGVGVARSTTGYYYAVQMLGLPRSASIKFEVRNESRRDVRYRVGEERYTVPAHALRTHEVCAHEALVFDRPGGSFQPRARDRFVIPPQGDTVTVRR